MNMIKYNEDAKDFRSRLNNGEVLLGIFLLTNNSFIAEAIATLKLDWILVDTEASSFSKEDTIHIIQAMKGCKALPLIRISEHNKSLIEFSLDIGYKGIMIPKVENIIEAKKLISPFFYPPKGSRGVNPIRVSNYFDDLKDYFKEANFSSLSIFQIETKEGIDNVDEIAKVNDVDVLFIGTGDLSASYNQFGILDGESMNIAREKVLTACKKYDKIAGIFAGSIESANKYISEGFKFVAIGNDIKFLKDSINENISKINK